MDWRKTIASNVWIYLIIGLCLGVLLNPAIEALNEGVPAFLNDLLPEAVGIAFTVIILERLNHRERLAAEKRDLIAQLSSSDNGITRHAIKLLWARGWLQDGSVKGASLWGANLQEADLGECDLREVNFWIANLRGAEMWGDFRGTNFSDAELKDAQLEHYKYGKITLDETTRLPDGTNWSSDTDMARFTDPQHPEFWRSDDERSPAFEQ